MSEESSTEMVYLARQQVLLLLNFFSINKRHLSVKFRTRIVTSQLIKIWTLICFPYFQMHTPTPITRNLNRVKKIITGTVFVCPDINFSSWRAQTKLQSRQMLIEFLDNNRVVCRLWWFTTLIFTSGNSRSKLLIT